jgi:hypothetical protein
MNATGQQPVRPMETRGEATAAVAAHSFYISSPYLGLQKEREQAKQPFAPAVSSPQDPFLVLEPSACLVLPWLLVVPPQGLPNNIIHPSLGRGIASGGRCFRRVMMSVMHKSGI